MKGDRRKEQILTAALRLFAGRGYHAATVADIVAEMGVARGTFYRYFRDKHDLFGQLLESNFRYVKKVLPAMPEDSSLTAADLEAVLAQGFRELLSRPDSRDFLTMMVNQAAAADPFFAAKIVAFYDDLAEVFAGYIVRFQTRGLLEPREPKAAAYLLLGAVREIFLQWARGGKFKDLEALTHEVASFLVYGLKGKTPAGPARR